MRKFSLSLLAVALLGVCSSSQAFFVNANGSYNGKADIDGSGGAEMSSSVYRLTAGGQYLTFSVKHTEYDFSGIDDPVDSLDHVALDGHYDFSLTQDFGLFTGLTLAMGFEDEIHLSDNYAITPRAGVSYTFAGGNQIFLGALAQFNEVDNIYLPIAGIKFGSDSDLGFSGSLAYPATKVTYRPSAYYAFEGVFLTVRDLYQLADDSKLSPEGYIFEKSYGAALGVIVNPLQMLELRFGVQSFFDREYEIYDAGGHELASYDVDPAMGFYGNLNFKF